MKFLAFEKLSKKIYLFQLEEKQKPEDAALLFARPFNCPTIGIQSAALRVRSTDQLR